jgi:acetyl-CoA synthetase
MGGPDTRPGRDGDGSVAPPASFVERANVGQGVRDAFAADWPGAWSRAGDLLDWARPYDELLTAADDELRWFAGGRLNASVNCVDRHLSERKNRVALRWIGTTGETRTYTYLDLHREVNEAAAALRSLGVSEGDVVTVYMPVLPELPVVMLACARLGALHNVVFAGYSADELAERVERTDSEYLVTCDGYYRRGSAVNQKNKADNARLSVGHDVETVVVSRFDEDVYLSNEHRSYEELLAAHEGATVEPVERDAADPLFVLYTSGTTGEPDRVTHTTGGYLAHVAWTGRSVLDITPEDTYWCAADIAWITGHSYLVYAPLALGTTTLLYEGAPDQPNKERLWELVERHRVDVFYTASTAVRAFMKWGGEYPAGHDLSSLRLLGMVGEPIDPCAWRWYREHVGGGRCPVVDTWWQTETGGILVSTLPAVDQMKPGAAGPPLPGVDVAIVDAAGDRVEPGDPGYLAVTTPWPGMPKSLAREAARTAEGVPDRDGAWAHVTSDRAVLDVDGYVRFLGRGDDAVGLGTGTVGAATIEAAIVSVEGVAEAAVVETCESGEVVAYVSTEHGRVAGDYLRERIEARVAQDFGAAVRPRTVVFVPELPKTHSGKVMRRLLAAVADGEEYGDTSALRNPETVGEIETVANED